MLSPSNHMIDHEVNFDILIASLYLLYQTQLVFTKSVK